MASLELLAPHVPAWKRLGLKLKNANDQPAVLFGPPPTKVSGTSSKRKAEQAERDKDQAASPRNAKRLKHTDSVLADVPANGEANDNPDSIIVSELATRIDDAKSLSTKDSESVKALRKKSVSFAPEAKTVDGDSTKDHYDQWLATEQNADPTFDPTTAASALKYSPPARSSRTSLPPQSSSTAPINQAQKKKKKRHKSKSTTLRPNILTSPMKSQSFLTEKARKSAATQPHPALAYLTTHHTSHRTWKFSKNHQTYLLKHLFSLDALPSTYDPALTSYLSGLRGLSARQSIREAVFKIREDDEMWLSDLIANGRRPEWEAKRRREEYEAAWKRERERLEEVEDEREWEEGREEWEWRVKKRRRAEVVLGAVGETETQVSDTAKATVNGPCAIIKANGKAAVFAQEGQQPQKKRRRRKRRTTGVPDDETSSSSSSSSSSSGSDSEEDKTATAALIRNRKGSNDSTPSSGLGGSATDGEEDDKGSESSSKMSENREEGTSDGESGSEEATDSSSG